MDTEFFKIERLESRQLCGAEFLKN